jgi:Beta-1,3-glucanase/Carbohydrate binding module (family 6)
MRHLPVLRLPALVRGWPGRSWSRSKSQSRPKVRVAIVLAALFALALTGANAAGSAAHAATEGPYGGTAAAVPGTVFAENYDTGGQGVAYNVTSVNGSANSYRSDGVDLEATTDTGGPANDLGWTAAGQWFKYTVNVATAGTYTVGLRLAAPSAVTDALHIASSAGTNLSGNVAAPATGGYQDWSTVIATVTLPAGTQTLTVDQDNAGWNINFLAFGLNSSGGGGGEAPYGGTAAAVPGTVQAENYDTGGQGVAYNVTSVNGSANSYRTDGVDLEATTDTGGGDDLGWSAAGQWFKYTVNVATAGTYNVGLRLAAPTAVTDALHIANSAGTNLSGNVTAPATGGYQTWTTVTVTLTLPAGTQTLTVDQDNAGWNINYLAFSSGSSGGGTGFGGFPTAFWGTTSSIPVSSNGIEFDFINATNGQYPDSEVYWDVNGVEESIAQSPYYSMASCNSCRIYFYLGSANSQYNDFIELNSTGTTINADTSRVDAFGLPLAVHLHNSNGSDTVVGEDDQVFSESRTALFTQFENFVPAAFQQLATVNAPYSIPSPTDVAAFQPGGADANYMTSYAASQGDTETTQQVFGCQAGGTPALNGNASLCAGLNRCVAQFSTTVQNTPSDYYKNAPCNYYSAFWHSVAVNSLAYGFAYDDDNGQSSDFNSTDAQYVQVAIGW